MEPGATFLRAESRMFCTVKSGFQSRLSSSVIVVIQKRKKENAYFAFFITPPRAKNSSNPNASMAPPFFLSHAYRNMLVDTLFSRGIL